MSGNKKAINFLWKLTKRVLFPLLWLLSVIYGKILLVRNKFFDWGWLKENKYDLPVISIGNITVGGTGKTPLTEYVIRLLADKYRVALLSRGYKRKTKGVVIATTNNTAEDIGDEPKQIQTKFPGITVAVAEKRTEGIERLLQEKQPEVIVLDDAFQHRYVKPGLSILVIDHGRPLWSDYPFPAGRLREPRSGQKRADVIVISKCPKNLSVAEKNRLTKKISPDPGQQIFFSYVEYLPPVNPGKTGSRLNNETKVIALAGIANPEPFFDLLSEKYHLKKKITFPDHHAFNKEDCEHIEALFQNIKTENKAIITTEKDFMRIKDIPCMNEETRSHIWYIPVKIAFLFDEEKKFNLLIKNYVEKDKKNRSVPE